MDGICSTSRTTTLLARRAASLVLAAVAALSFAAPASADPAADFAPGTPALAGALEIAGAHWQTSPCAGQVEIVWMGLSERINATSTWANPVSQYDAPEQNSACRIAFNTEQSWDWTRLCSILVHEYGHLSGHAHADARDDVMYAYYETPAPRCVAAAPVIAPVGVAADPAAAQPRAISASRSAKRGRLVPVKRRGPKHRQHRRSGAQRVGRLVLA